MISTGLTSREIELISSCLGQNPSIEQVLLFGSRAKGNHKPYSDVDLAIFGIEDELQIESLSLSLNQLPLPYKFDVKSFSSIRNHLLQEHILRVGIKIYPVQQTNFTGEMV